MIVSRRDEGPGARHPPHARQPSPRRRRARALPGDRRRRPRPGPTAPARPSRWICTPGISADGRLLATGIDDASSGSGPCPTGGRSGRGCASGSCSATSSSARRRWLTVVVSDEYYDKEPPRCGTPDPPPRANPRAPGQEAGFLRFGPDGKLLAMGYRRGLSQVWSTTTWKPVTRPLAADAGAIVERRSARRPHARHRQPGGHRADVGHRDRAGPRRRASRPARHPGHPLFTADGKHLIASYETGRAYHWDIRPESLARHACQVAGRRLTRAEWAQFLPDRPYEPAC